MSDARDREERRLTLANMHALANAARRTADAETARGHLDALAQRSPPRAPPLSPADPRSDAQLGVGVHPPPAARRVAARLRGAILGAAAHPDAVRKEVVALARVAVDGEGLADRAIELRAVPAFDVSREDAARNVVRLAPVPRETPGESSDAAAWTRRWGGARSLELHGFVATFTRDGTEPTAVAAVRDGLDGAGLRLALAVAEAAMSLPRDTPVDASLEQDVARVERVLPTLLARLIAHRRT